jgi:hypothetical protein
MLTVVNAATAALAANATGTGQILYFDPITPEGLATGAGFIDMGYLPEGTRLTPNVEITRENLKGAGRESAASITLQTVVTDSSYGYEFGILTPDSNVRALHAGSAAATLTGAGMTGVKVYKINPEASVTGRFVFVKKRPNGPHDVIFHPRLQLSSNGTAGGDLNSEIYNFVASVQAYSWTPGADLAGITVASVTQYGALFVAQNDAELDALLTALNDEALT